MLRNLIVLAVLLGSAPAARADVEFQASVSFDTFHQPLAAHGQWVTVGSHGRVWRPYHVVADWRPYLDGQWVWTDDGWLWVSDEPWAWATYHYGRWSWEPGWGWIWVPGYEWAPAWVEWRYSAGCVGWAPLLAFGHGIVHRPIVYEHWTFVPSHSFVGVHARPVAWAHHRVREHWHRTTVAPSWHGGRRHDRDRDHDRYGSPSTGSPTVHQAEPAFGPPRTFVERETGKPVHAVRPVRVSSPAELGRSRGAPEVFRPSRVERPAAAYPAPPAQERSRAPATYPAAPDRRDLRTGRAPVAPQSQPRPMVTRPESARPEPRPMVTRPEPARPAPRPMVTRPDHRSAFNRPESRSTAPRPESRPAVSRPQPARPAPAPVYRPQEASRPAPQRLAPQARPESRPQPAVRPSAGASSAPRHVVPQAQPSRRSAGKEGRRR